MRRFVFLLAVMISSAVSAAAAPAFNPKPWLADLDEVRDAMATKYANLEWAMHEREADLPGLFAETRTRIEVAANNSEARAAFDRFARRLGDGHFGFSWPGASPSSAPTDAAVHPCAGYDSRYVAKPLAAAVFGYNSANFNNEFPSGIIEVGKSRADGIKVGIIKIGIFMPQGFPELCRDAMQALAIPNDRPCDDVCAGKIDAWTNDRLTRDFIQTVRGLKEEGVAVLLIDIAGNGGGSEWAEAVARIVTAKPVRSEVRRVIQGEHWAKIFAEYEHDLRDYAEHAQTNAERAYLYSWVAQVEIQRRAAEAPCYLSPPFPDAPKRCALIDGSFGSGLLPANDARARGKPWANLFFSPNQYPYEEGVWDGPLIVLVDKDVASAATQFTAILQDGHAAVVVGEPTEGGCGHTDGGTPVTLSHSKGVLSLPDCARFHGPDDRNEAGGIIPDIFAGFGLHDGPAIRVRRLEKILPEAIARAIEQNGH